MSWWDDLGGIVGDAFKAATWAGIPGIGPAIAASELRLRSFDLSAPRARINRDAAAAITINAATGIPISTAISRIVECA